MRIGNLFIAFCQYCLCDMTPPPPFSHNLSYNIADAHANNTIPAHLGEKMGELK